MRLSFILLAAALLAFSSTSAMAATAKVARCVIKTSDGAYTGPCKFSPDRGGAFNLSPLGKTEFFKHAADDPGITDIRVDVAGNRAEVHGLTTSGINSRWGEAKRAKSDRACWAGDDFLICAY